MQFPNGRYWWMSTNPDTFKTWSLFDMKEGRANGCYWLMKTIKGITEEPRKLFVQSVKEIIFLAT